MKTSLKENYKSDNVSSSYEISNQWNILFIDVSYHFHNTTINQNRKYIQLMYDGIFQSIYRYNMT